MSIHASINPASEHSVLNDALELGAKGYKVIPLKPGEKKPLQCGWPEKASQERNEIIALFKICPGCNIGIVTNGLIAIDIDRREDGDGFRYRDAMKQKGGDSWREAPKNSTPSGGEHVIFRISEKLAQKYNVKSRSNVLGKNSRVDIKTGQGSYLVAPPSIVNGKSYSGSLPNKEDIPMIPEPLLEFLSGGADPDEPVKSPLKTPLSLPAFFHDLGKHAQERWRFLQACKQFGVLAPESEEDWKEVMLALCADVEDKGLSKDEAWEILDDWSQTTAEGTKCPSYDYKENHRRFKSATSTGSGKSRITFGTLHYRFAEWLRERAPQGKAVDLLLKIFKGAPVSRSLALAAINRDWIFINSYGNGTCMWSWHDKDVCRLSDFKARLQPLKIASGKSPLAASVAWLEWHDRAQADSIGFDPGKGELYVEDGKNWVNRYGGLKVMSFPRPDNPEAAILPFVEHIRDRLCQGDEKLYDEFIKLLAWWVQNLDKPGQKAIVLRGGQGTGKTLFGGLLRNLFAPHAYQTGDSEKIMGRFNKHMAETLFINADEAFFAGSHEQRRHLKALVTDQEFVMEAKGKDAIRQRNYVRLMMTTNEDWAVPADHDDRRFFVLDVAPRRSGDEDYFARFANAVDDDEAVAAFYYFLEEQALGEWHPSHMKCKTKAHLEQRLRSLGPVERFAHECLAEGSFPVKLKKVSGQARLFVSDYHADNHPWPEDCEGYVLPAGKNVITELINKNYVRFSDGRLTKVIVAKRLKVCLGAETKKINGDRVWLLPPLGKARENFERFIGQSIDWENGEETDAPERHETKEVSGRQETKEAPERQETEVPERLEANEAPVGLEAKEAPERQGAKEAPERQEVKEVSAGSQAADPDKDEFDRELEIEIDRLLDSPGSQEGQDDDITSLY